MAKYKPFPTIVDGEPVKLNRLNVEGFTCCDCALTHFLVYEIDEGGRLTIYSYRDEYRTKEERKRVGISGIRYKKKAKK